MEITDNLREFLETGEDWERKSTSLPAICLIRLPSTRSRPASLAIEVNPQNENGRPMKKKGLMIMSTEEIAAFREIFLNPKLETLMQAIEAVLPEKKTTKKASRDVIEI